MTLLADKPSLLAAMMADQVKQESDLYKPSAYWLPYQVRVSRHISRHGIGKFRSDPLIGKGFSDSLRPLPFDWDGNWKSRIQGLVARLPIVSSLLAQREKEIVRARQFGSHMQSRLHLAYMGEDFARLWPAEKPLPESTLGGCEAFYTPPGGKPMATLYLRMASRIVEYTRQLPVSGQAFMEIGGGFGAMTHLMLDTFPHIRKVLYIDIPPMLYLANQYLGAFYPESVRDYEELRDKTSITFRDDDSLEILCLPPWMIERVTAKIDLFHNAASFSEMNEEIVRNYATNMRRLSAIDSHYWLILNKIDHPTADAICTPEQIDRCFDWLALESSFNFEENLLRYNR